jgi:hypothetical protein
MDRDRLGHVVWCDLVIAQLRIHSSAPWDTKMVHTSPVSDPTKPTVDVFLCDEDDDIFGEPRTYREKMMRRGSYRGHHVGPPARLRLVDETHIALAHPDPGTIIWSLVVKYVLTVFAARCGVLHLKGAAVSHRGRALLVLGRGGSGKTEVVRELGARGARLLANTHLLIDGAAVHGVRSNIRVRDGGRDVHVPLEGTGLEVQEGWLPIGGVLLMDYRHDGHQVLEPLPPRVARANLRYFGEAVSNWELKEDMADLTGSDPVAFADLVNRTEDLLDAFCTDHEIHHATLDVRSPEGLAAVLGLLEASRQ